MNESKVTVVLPIYNVEQYLERCIESVINQSLKEIEIILVNDGSTDKSGEICEKYEKLDNRIKVIYQKNSGLSAARNTGIANANSKYICFIDSDDYIELDMIEYLYNGMLNNNSQITCCGFTNIYENGKLEKITKEIDEKIYDKKEALDIHLLSGYIEVVAWNKLYDISLFEDIKYPEGKLYEDMLTTYKLIDKANKVVLLSNSKYYYCKRKTSIGGKKFSEKTLTLLDACDEVYDFAIKKYGKLENIIVGRIQWYIVILNKMIVAQSVDVEMYKKIRKMIAENLKVILFNKYLNIIRKIQNVIIFLFPLRLYIKFYISFINKNR